MTARELFDRVRAGDRSSLAKAISLVESHPDLFNGSVDRSVPVVGITGPPGVGKSTLVSSLIAVLRDRSKEVAVLAVDPSSPVTGGALLGDRIRMQDHVTDTGVFVRSMASRGHLGGLSAAAGPVVALLSNAGFDYLLVETVGVGQSEVEVMDLADVVALVVSPGWGDQIQADKAGIVEIADLFVINKGDQPGVEAVRRALSEIAETGARDRPIVVTTATTGKGVEGLADALGRLLAD